MTEARRRPAGADRVTVILFTVAGFLAVLAFMAAQLRAAPSPRRVPTVVVRRVYVTRVIETVRGAAGGGTSVSQSVSSSGSAGPVSIAATTRTSG